MRGWHLMAKRRETRHGSKRVAALKKTPNFENGAKRGAERNEKAALFGSIMGRKKEERAGGNLPQCSNTESKKEKKRERGSLQGGLGGKKKKGGPPRSRRQEFGAGVSRGSYPGEVSQGEGRGREKTIGMVDLREKRKGRGEKAVGDSSVADHFWVGELKRRGGERKKKVANHGNHVRGAKKGGGGTGSSKKADD